MRKRVVLTLTLVCAISLLSCSQTNAQQASNPALGVALVHLLQGQEIKLPEDFVARLDGNNLKLALKSMGLGETNKERDLLVFLIQEDGEKSEMRPDEKGELTFYNVKEGLAAIVVASGQVAYAAMAVYAEKIAPAIDKVVAPFEIPVGSVEADKIRPGVDAAGHAPRGESVKRLADYRPRPINRFRVYLQPDGLLLGHVIVPEAGFERGVAGVNLSFFRDRIQVAQTVSADDGSFSVDGLTPGIHSVFASGPPGHAAFAFEVVAPKIARLPISETENSAKSLLISTQAGTQREEIQPAAMQPVLTEPADELIVLLIPPTLMPGVREVVGRMYPLGLGANFAGPLPIGPGLGAPSFGAPFSGGGFAGGYGGGGGLGGGGGGIGGGLGGLGGLLGIAGLAVGVAALADDDDAGINLATPIGP